MDKMKNQLKAYNKEWLVSTLLSVGDAVITTNQEGYITFANSEALSILGLDLEDVIQKPFHSVFKVYTERDNSPLVFFDVSLECTFYEHGLPKTAYFVDTNHEKIYLSAKSSTLQSSKDGFLGFVVVFRNITKIIETEKQMEQEKNSLELMFELLPSGMIMLNKEMQAVKVNPTFLKIFGQVEKRVIGKALGEVIRCVWSYEGTCGTTNHCSFCQFRKLSKEMERLGEVIKEKEVEVSLMVDEKPQNKWVKLSLMPIQLNEEWLYLLTVDDITERFHHEKELEKAKTNSLMLLDHLPVMICRYDVFESCTFINGTFRRYLEMPETSKALDIYLKKRMKKSDYLSFVNDLKRCFNSKEILQFDTAIKTSDGLERSMLGIVAPIIEEDKLKGAIGVFLDMHEAREAQALYLKSQIKYKLLFDHLDSSVSYLKVIRNHYGEIVDAEVKEINPVTQKLFGKLATHWSGMRLSESGEFPDPLKQRLLMRFKQVLQKGESIHLDDYYFEPLEKWIDVSIYTPEKDYVVILASDVDEKKRAELALLEAKERSEEANRSKSDFLANMSHEIRTPLNGIVGMIDLTLLEPLSGEQKDNLFTAKECVKTLIDIINDVLDFSKIEAGKLKVNPETFDVKKLIETTVKAHLVHAEQKGLLVNTLYMTPVSDFLFGDGKRIKQILNNLISNAIKFTNQGSVTVQVIEMPNEKNETHFLHISVQDTGIGIPIEKQSALFKSFTQIDGSYTRQYGGTGLGLVISKQLVELLGGKIAFRSIHNQGSVFQFSVPLRKSSGGFEGTREESLLIHDFGGLKVLLVEDDRVNQIVMTKMLEKMNVLVSYAENGFEAVKRCNEQTFDLILMDIQMPVMDGISATRKIREKHKAVPIVALTAYALEGDEAIFMASGMNGYLSKPVQSATLVRMMQRFSKDEEDLIAKRIKAFSSESPVRLDEENIEKAVSKLEKISELLDLGNVVLLEKIANELKNHFEKMGAEELKRLAFKMALEIRKERTQNVTGLIGQAYAILNPLRKEEASDEENIDC